METTLFWIGCGLGVYAFLLRRVFSRDNLLRQKALTAGLHILFMAAVGGLIGFVFSASMELHGPTPKWPFIAAIISVLIATIQLSRGNSSSEKNTDLLAGDLEWVETSFSAILLASVIMYAVVQAFKIPSGSMENTLLIGDHLFVNKFVYGVRIPFTERRIARMHEVRRREIVVFEAPQSAIMSPEEKARNVHKDFIKRAIGLPGDTIEIKNKKLFVNGDLQNEPFTIYKDPGVYPAERVAVKREDYQRLWESGKLSTLRREEIGDNFGPITVPPDSYFVMGDNRDGSFDSRFWGPLPNRLLKGKAWLVYWPFNRVKIVK